MGVGQVFLYRDMLTTKIGSELNYHNINEFNEVIEKVQDFVFKNIYDLVELRLRSAPFRNVVQKAVRKKATLVRRRKKAIREAGIKALIVERL